MSVNVAAGSDRITPEDVAANWVALNARVDEICREVGRSRHELTIVAVSKTMSVDLLTAAYEAGARDFGENHAVELVGKATQMPEVNWHFVGRLQSNKINALAPYVSRYHSIDREKTASALAVRAPGARVFVQVNLAGEAQKGGCGPDKTGSLVEHCQANGLEVDGLMTVPPVDEDPTDWFIRLRALADDLSLVGCSMGMSDDFDAAIRTGATTLRIGRTIFGPRQTFHRSTPTITRSR
jgi:pyridoxal phosphate enzyme (YggS family)